MVAEGNPIELSTVPQFILPVELSTEPYQRSHIVMRGIIRVAIPHLVDYLRYHGVIIPHRLWYTDALKYEEMTREERTRLMLTDLPAYMELLTDEHYFQLFDGIARLGEYQPEEDE